MAEHACDQAGGCRFDRMCPRYAEVCSTLRPESDRTTPDAPGVVQHCNPRTEYEVVRHAFDPDGCGECRTLEALITGQATP